MENQPAESVKSKSFVETLPVHIDPNSSTSGRCPKVVILQAYEVYRNIFGEQKDIIEGRKPVGLGVNELIALLYAYSYPQDQWSMRVEEAYTGMKGL